MIFEAIMKINPNAKVYVNDTGDINTSTIEWLGGTTPISNADIEAKIAEMPTPEEEAQAQADLRASAKAKLMSGEALTEEEANTIVL